MGSGKSTESVPPVGIPAAYQDAKRLGAGAEGGTWLATDRGTGRPVVLKHVASDRIHVVRRAFELLRTVGSPHLPAARSLAIDGDDPECRWLATDFVEGTTLPAVATTQVAALREALAIGHALAAIHRCGTHHGDVSPGNVIVTGTGGVILVDLGQLGQLGTGTPGFLAPEVLAGGGGPAADRFALGSLLALRLFGAVPWHRPEVLLRVRGLDDVDARLAVLAGDAPLGAELLGLLRLLLHPDPQRRIGAPEVVVDRLAGLVRAAEAGVDLPDRTTWWLPRRWPYRAGPGGADVLAIAERIATRTPLRLVVVAGPVGVGRRRVVEEVVQQLQAIAAAPTAVACEPDAAGAVLGQPAATWIEAWLSNRPGQSGAVLGLVAEPQWPSLGEDPDEATGALAAKGHAALLLDAATTATTVLIVVVGQRLARALNDAVTRTAQQDRVAVVHVRPWDPPTLGRALGEVLQCDDPEAWSRVLLDATGGWPGRLTRAVTACATVGVETPTPAAVERALEDCPDAAVLGLDAALARDVLHAWWSPTPARLLRLPMHLHDGTGPRAAAVAEARRTLAGELSSLSRAAVQAQRALGAPVGLALAVDADLADDVEAGLLRDHTLPVARAGSGTVLRWLLKGGAVRIADAAVAVACRGLLADGDARRGLALAQVHPQGAQCRLQAARASQRMGQTAEAMAHLACATALGDADETAAAEGLRWRLMVDTGRATEAARDAIARIGTLASRGLGAATAHLWGAMACVVAGEAETAARWLDVADHAATEAAGLAAASIESDTRVLGTDVAGTDVAGTDVAGADATNGGSADGKASAVDARGHARDVSLRGAGDDGVHDADTPDRQRQSGVSAVTGTTRAPQRARPVVDAVGPSHRTVVGSVAAVGGGLRPGPWAGAAAGVLARVAQLRGNIAQARGDLAAAYRYYATAADRFADASEPVGGLMVRGSLAGLAIPTFGSARGIADGRAALRGLVARGQLSATLEAALNLVQLLCRTGAQEQAAGVAALAEVLFAGQRHGDRRVRGRLSRIDAELTRRKLGLPKAEDAFVAAAVDLEAAGAAREAVEAWVCACAAARSSDGLQRAAAHLDRASAIAADDPDSRVAIVIETLEFAIARAHQAGDSDLQRAVVQRSYDAVVALGKPQTWAARGRLDVAWAVSRTTALVDHHRFAPGHSQRRDGALAIVTTLEQIMNKTEPADQRAVRTSLMADVGDRSALRELLSELDPEAVATGPAAIASTPTAVAPTPSDTGPARLSGLIRVYRRLAREDRLDVLLEQVVDAMMELTDAERGAVVVLQHPTGSDDAPAARIEVTRELSAAGQGVQFSRSVIDRVLAHGEPVLSVDAAHDDRFDGSRSISHLNLRSVLAVPLRFRGELFGAAYVDHRLRRGAFDENDLGHMEQFADLAALAVAHARAVEALRSQASQLEEQRERLASMLQAREVEVEGLRGQVPTTAPGQTRHGMVGSAPAMGRIFRLIDRLADSDVPVVIHGESGTGKELVARAIHRSGTRAEAAFIAENCGAIPETLLESVLFGHARGAFTGAAKSKAGLFEAADGGTIFLDEVGEMSPAMQTKLLRVLQEGEVRRVGENQSRPVDVRVIAASNRDLDAMVADGTFRRDLYYRINVVTLSLPALREREGDLPALVQHFATAFGRPELTVTSAAMRILCGYAWPGNVRELQNEVQRWIALCEGAVEVEDLSPALCTQSQPGPDVDDLQIRPRVDLLERDLIGQALERTGGNQTKAATLLGLSRFGLQKKLRRMAEAQTAEEQA